MNQQATAFNSRLLLLWMFACGTMSIFSQSWFIAINSGFGERYQPYSSLLNTLLFISVMVIPFIITFAPYVPLRRLCNQSFAGKWFVCMLITGGITIAMSLAVASSVHFFGFKPPSIYQLKLELLDKNYVAWSDYLLNLFWLKLMATTAAHTFIKLGVACLLISKMAKLKWWHLMLAAIGASLVCEIGLNVLDITGLQRMSSYMNPSLSGVIWPHRFLILFNYAAAGMFWAYVSYWLLFALQKTYPKHDASSHQWGKIGLVLVVVACANLLFHNPFWAQYIIHSLTLKLSLTPKQDIATGQTILKFSHYANIEPPQYPVWNFSPDGKTLVMMDNKRTLQRIDLATGNNLGAIGKPVASNQQYSQIWSESGKYFVRRVSGQRIELKEGYFKYRSQFELYDGATYLPLTIYAPELVECLDVSSFDHNMAFEGDALLWALCGHQFSNQQPENVMAIKLKLPSMQVADSKKYREYAQYFNATNLFADNGEVFALQANTIAKGQKILIHTLSTTKPPVQLPDLTDPSLGGSLTKQGETLQNGVIAVRFCGDDVQVSNPQQRVSGKKTVHSFCRVLTFNLKTGHLINTIDDANNQRFYTSAETLDTSKRYQISSQWESNQKKGLLRVMNEQGKAIQTIETTAQQRIQITPNGDWMLSYAPHENKVRVYAMIHSGVK